MTGASWGHELLVTTVPQGIPHRTVHAAPPGQVSRAFCLTDATLIPRNGSLPAEPEPAAGWPEKSP
jgi:hypothetical protein